MRKLKFGELLLARQVLDTTFLYFSVVLSQLYSILGCLNAGKVCYGSVQRTYKYGMKCFIAVQ